MYKFPSYTGTDPTTGKPSGTNCTACIGMPDGTWMLPPGKYVVEVIVPPGFELVKEEDKNILMGDIYVAPVTTQFAGFGNVFIMPDQAAVNAFYNKNNPLNATSNLGSVTYPRHEGDTGTIESYWPCVGAMRIVPDYNSLFPGVQQTAPFAGASRPLCDRKEVTLQDKNSVLAKFYVFTPAHIAGHFTGTITNDFASEFDPFSPQFGEKFGPPNLPVGLRDFSNNEMGRVYSDQWGIYNGLYFSSWEVNPPNPTGYAPQMAITCMNDPGPVARTNAAGQYVDASGATVATADQAATMTDPSYNPAYSNFCYEMPFMPGFTAYMDTPVIPTQAFADGYNLPDSEYPDGTPAIAMAVSSSTQGPWVAAAAGSTLTLTALGDKVVQNPNFSGPNATSAPFNQKTITRHYGFGSQCTSVGGSCAAISSVTIGGVNAPVTSWSDTSITVSVPSGVPSCEIQQMGAPPAQCGEVVITAGNGKSSIDAITLTIGGKAPTMLQPGQTIQSVIDAASPGDLILVPAGTYKEHVLMWKPVRLQGVGAASVTINADAHPAGVLDSWRRQVDCLFGLTIQGVPSANNANYDPSGQYGCPDAQFLRVDRIPFEAIVGWDASGNGNLAQVLQEPTLLGAYEGAGITVLGRGVRAPDGSTDFWGQNVAGGAGAFTDGSVYLGNNEADCASDPTITDGTDYGTSNYYCNPSRIDGLSVTNSSQGGGAIFIHGWAHNLEVGNTRILANHGTLAGGINLGNGETPEAYVNDGVQCGVTPPVALCPPTPAGTALNAAVPFQFNANVRLHHNMIYDNASIGDALFSGTPAGAGAITISAGADGYQIDHNWISGNLSSGDGAGIQHLGLSFNGRINNNYILFNQSTNPTLPTNGGGIAIEGANLNRTVAGNECGTFNDLDCPPGLGEGTGPGLVIDSNLIVGNSAESGSGGGLRLQQINGAEVVAFPGQPANWYDVTVTNNIIANNVAGWDGAGISLEDAFKVKVINNTIASNDTTSSAGVLFKTLGAVNASSPPSDCYQDPTNSANLICPGINDGNGLPTNAAHVPQPAGLVTERNTPNMISALSTLTVTCPAGYGYSGGNCTLLSLPLLANDLFWQNRAFHVAITAMGSNLQSQQNLVAMFPQLNQTFTGECASGASYWDVGVRDDGTGSSLGVQLTLMHSILTSTQGVIDGSSTSKPNVAPASSPVVHQYCNGARVAPEICSAAAGGGILAGDPICKGFNAPAGRSETTGVGSLFVFNNIQPTATVDEGHNWINLSYGPLTITMPGETSSSPAEQMLTVGSVGVAQGAYSPVFPSAAIGGGAAVAGSPDHDFYGAARNPAVGGLVDIGAVSFAGPEPAFSPTSLSFGNVFVGQQSTARTVTLSNNGSANFTFASISVSSPFGSTTTCVSPLAPGASCTVSVTFGPTAAGAASGTVSVAGGNVTPTPVAHSGTGVAPTYTASITPGSPAFGGVLVGQTSATQNLTVANTGNQPLTGFGYAWPAGFSRVDAGGFPAGAPDCPTTTAATLAVGASCTIKVQFAPTAAQPYSANPTVTATNATFTPAARGRP